LLQTLFAPACLVHTDSASTAQLLLHPVSSLTLSFNAE